MSTRSSRKVNVAGGGVDTPAKIPKVERLLLPPDMLEENASYLLLLACQVRPEVSGCTLFESDTLYNEE